ncbi:hypothetical protein Emed_005581 [Eimeria media]
MEGDNSVRPPRPQEIPNSIRQKANEIRAQIEACPAHANTIPGFISAVAAHDVETEQFIGAYCVRRPELPEIEEEEEDEFEKQIFRMQREALKRTLKEREAATRARRVISWPRSRKPAEDDSAGDLAGAHVSQRCRDPGNLSPDVLDFFHSLLVHDAQDSNTCSACTVQYRPFPASKPTHRTKPKPGEEPEAPPCAAEETAGGQPKEVRKPLGLGSFLPFANQPALLVLAHDGIVGSLVNDLGDDAQDGDNVLLCEQAYTYNHLTDELSRVKEDEPSPMQCPIDDSCPSPFREEKCVVVGCRLEAEGARNASAAMANARVCYVAPGNLRKSAGFSLGPQRVSQSEREIVVNRLALMEPALRSIPGGSSTTSSFQSSIPPAVHSAPVGAADVMGSSEASSSSRMRPFSYPAAAESRASTTNPRMHFGSDSPMLPTLAEDHYSSANSVSSGSSRESDDPFRKRSMPSDSFWGEFHALSTVGVIFCINPKAPDSQLLVKALAEVCSAPLAVLHQLHWLRRDRCKRMLQLELHRTVFQETTLPIRMMQRFLALLHVAVGAEAASFFIIDAQNRNYICLGGHRNHVLLIPLLSTQGQVKAVVLLLNKQSCRCARLFQNKYRTDDACICKQQVRSFTEASLAIDAWSPPAPPCESCCRAQEDELTYGDYITTPSWVHEVLMRSVQCELQQFLGGQLTNLCMTGLSLLEPMQTMISYVMGDQQRGGKGAVKPFGAVMAQIQNFVMRDKRLKLLSLRRCESVAATEPESPISGSDADADTGRKVFGFFSSRRGSKAQQSTPSATTRTAASGETRRPASSIFHSLRIGRWRDRNQRVKDDDAEGQQFASRISLPVTVGADRASQPSPLMHSSSAPLEVSFALREPYRTDLVSSSTLESFDPLEEPLAHDVDHPGVNNRSLCEEQHPLAIMYNDKAVLENHHASFAARTMMQLGLFSRRPETRASAGMPLTRGRSAQTFGDSSDLRPTTDQNVAFGEGNEDESFYPEFAKIRRVVINCILATDMELFSHHHEAMRTRAQVNRSQPSMADSFRTDEDRTLLMNCLIHCADISNPLLPERRNVQWASLIVQEFNAQVEMERHKGLPVTTFMDQRTELLRTQSQIGFLSFVVLDQFRALADLVPGVDELIAQGERNLEEWQQALDVLKEAEKRDM